MTVQSQREKVLDRGANVVAEVTSEVFNPPEGANSVQIKTFSEDAGTLDVDELIDGEWREVDSVAITANTLDVLVFPYAPIGLRTRFTSSAQTGDKKIVGCYSGRGKTIKSGG